jgi:hypothetical protein
LTDFVCWGIETLARIIEHSNKRLASIHGLICCDKLRDY